MAMDYLLGIILVMAMDGPGDDARFTGSIRFIIYMCGKFIDLHVDTKLG
jgi:hypothetical protein